jgi:hypothetical protein
MALKDDSETNMKNRTEYIKLTTKIKCRSACNSKLKELNKIH